MRRLALVIHVALFLPLLVASGCGGNDSGAADTERRGGNVVMALEITSGAFEHEQPIPERYSCDGENISPALSWSGVAAGTVAFALICDDPDAPMGTWVHWTIFNIPGDSTGLAEALPAAGELPDDSVQGTNSWSRIGYGGPCPPPGKPHRYYFKLYALDALLSLDSAATKDDILAAMQGHLRGQAQIMGTYGR